MLVDVLCPKCNTLYENKILFGDEVAVCDLCNVECEKQVNFDVHFRLKYDNKKDKVSWGAEGYRESQYYTKQKELCKGNIFVQGGTKDSEK